MFTKFSHGFSQQIVESYERVKADRGERGIVVRDILRRLVARTMAQRVPTVAETATALLRVRRTRRAGSHRPQSRGHRRVHRRHGGIRSDLPEREKGFVQMENEGSGTLLRAQFRRTPVHISVGDEMGTVTRDLSG